MMKLMITSMPKRFSLAAQNWQLGQTDRLPFDAPTVDDRPAVSRWMPAVVPGNVRLDLLANGLLTAPPHQNSHWVDDADWWYRMDTPPALAAGTRAFIRFHGLDYRAAIFANNRELLRHEGMFSRVTVEITDCLHTDTCQIAVRLWGSGALPRRKLSRREKMWQTIAQRLQRSWTGVYPDRSATLKTQMSFGWDFAPRVLTIGIWDTVEGIVTGETFIADAQIAVQPDGRGTLRLKLDSHMATDIPVILKITDTDSEHRFRFSTFGTGGTHHFRFDLPAPKLWQPWDRGDPHLYRARVEIPGSDAVTLRFGVRSVSLKDWQFSINGQPEFVRGVNWVPADIFPGRITPADYRELLSMANNAGANLVRVWGGGLREKAAFYDICDELGLLVWQEFPFACLFLGSAPRTDDFLSLVAQEAGEIVRQLDAHPSVVVWCGGNEINPRRNRHIIRTLETAIAENSLSARPFLPASPTAGEAHHWDVWHGLQPLAAYRREKARFLSEFGLQALPRTDTLPERWEDWLGDTEKLQRYLQNFLTIPYTRNDIPTLIEASQRAQTTGLQIAIEHIRRRKKETGGVILWQFNEPLPAISWAIVDYFRRPKLAFERLADWFNPILVSVDFPPGKRWRTGDTFSASVWVVNDTLQPVSGICTVAMNGVAVFAASVTVPPNTAVVAGDFSAQLKDTPAEMVAVLEDADCTMTRNRYDLRWHDASGRRWGLWLRRRIADWALR